MCSCDLPASKPSIGGAVEILGFAAVAELLATFFVYSNRKHRFMMSATFSSEIFFESNLVRLVKYLCMISKSALDSLFLLFCFKAVMIL